MYRYIYPFLSKPTPKEMMATRKKQINANIKQDFFKYAGRNK